MPVEILSKNAVRQHQAAGDERVVAVTIADVDLRIKEDFVREISNLWRDVQRRVLMIGRYLNRAKTLLAHGEFQQMIKMELPFSEQVAYQMRQVAAAVDAGRFLEEELPRNYSVAYQLVTLSEREVQIARQRQLFRPDVRRSELLAFKRELRLVQPISPSQNRDELLAERARLLQRLAEIEVMLGLTLENNDSGDIIAPVPPTPAPPADGAPREDGADGNPHDIGE
jgi:hypothetical protein